MLFAPFNQRFLLIRRAGRGLGAVVAEKFAAEGCNLAINYLFSQEQADGLAAELAKKHSIKAVTIQAVRIASGIIKDNSIPECQRSSSHMCHQTGCRCGARLCATGSVYDREIERVGHHHLECSE